VNFTILEGLYNPLVDIHANYFDPVCRECAGGGQTDISKPDDAYFVEVQSLLLQLG
jgi:hypothetical protein